MAELINLSVFATWPTSRYKENKPWCPIDPKSQDKRNVNLKKKSMCGKQGLHGLNEKCPSHFCVWIFAPQLMVLLRRLWKLLGSGVYLEEVDNWVEAICALWSHPASDLYSLSASRSAETLVTILMLHEQEVVPPSSLPHHDGCSL